MVVALLETFNLTVRSNSIDAIHVLLKAVEGALVKQCKVQCKVKVLCDEQKTEQSLPIKLSHSAG